MEGMPVSGMKLPEIGDEIAGKYRIETVLGQGGMGTVYSAQNRLTGKRVAIKWLLPEHAQGPSRERLLREARIACSVEHPNIVDIYDVGEHDGGLFLVMEYLRGRALSDLLAERGRLEPGELIGLLIPAMRGVHAAHQAGVIHRDLKPENILLSEIDGQIVPKVVDFGVSKTVGASVPLSSLTRTGALVGTPHYMALEQVDGSNLIDARTDVYAFGVILYRALTGYFPFDGTTLGEVILKIGTKDPAPLRQLRPDLAADLEAVVLKAMARVREQRFATLDELSRALEAYAPRVRFRELDEASGRISSALHLGDYRLASPQAAAATHDRPKEPQALPASTPGRLSQISKATPVGAFSSFALQGLPQPRPAANETQSEAAGSQGTAWSTTPQRLTPDALGTPMVGTARPAAGDGDGPGGAVPRHTPADHLTHAHRTRAFWVGAGFALLALLVVVGLLLRPTSQELARPVPRLPDAPAVGAAPAVAPPSAQQAVQPASEQTAVTAPLAPLPTPEPGPLPADTALQTGTVDLETPPTDAESPAANLARDQVDESHKARGKRRSARELAPAGPALTPTLIPGDRTKGLSADEF